jgi:acyl-CoA dehydrogenase
LPIYEGTNGIQAIDLVTRKIKLENGETLALELKQCEDNVARVLDVFGPSQICTLVTKSLDALRACAIMLVSAEPRLSLAAATPFQRALATTIACGYLMNSACEVPGIAERQQALTEAKFFAGTEVALAIAQCETALACAELIVGARLA